MVTRHPDLDGGDARSWLSVGVDATLVAAWAGHSVGVLLKVYAHAVDVRDQVAETGSSRHCPRRLVHARHR